MSNIKSEPLLALLSGQNEKALALLHNESSPGTICMRLRALLRIHAFERAISVAQSVDLEIMVYEESIAVLSMHIYLLARVGRIHEATAMIPELRRYLQPQDHLGLLECDYVESYLDYCRGRYSDCIKRLEKILVETNVVTNDRRRYAFQQDVYAVRAKAGTLVGVIYANYGRFNDMEKAHSTALLAAEQSVPRDAFIEALILANLSCLIGEVFSPSAIRLLQNRVRSIRWNAGLEEHRVYIKRHLRMATFLFNPLIDTRVIGGRSAPSLAFRLAECVDSLLLDDWTSFGEYEVELRFAKEFISRVDWQATDGEEYTSLYELVPLLAPFDLEAACDAHGRAKGKLLSLLPHIIGSNGPRTHSSLHFARACLAKAEGDFTLMHAESQAALSLWLSIGVTWRAAVVAVELFTVTKEQRLLDIAKQFVLKHPGTSFANRMSRALRLSHGADPRSFVYLRSSISQSSSSVER